MVPLWLFPMAVTAGNTFVLKPSERDPGASMMLADLAQQAGLPKCARPLLVWGVGGRRGVLLGRGWAAPPPRPGTLCGPRAQRGDARRPFSPWRPTRLARARGTSPRPPPPHPSPPPGACSTWCTAPTTSSTPSSTTRTYGRSPLSGPTRPAATSTRAPRPAASACRRAATARPCRRGPPAPPRPAHARGAVLPRDPPRLQSAARSLGSHSPMAKHPPPFNPNGAVQHGRQEPRRGHA
jgi:hypothetical protein